MLADILGCAAYSYAQIGGATSSNAPPAGGAYDPHPLPARMEAAPPIEQAPKDAFTRDASWRPSCRSYCRKAPLIQEACDGFKKLGDCVSTIHVAQNLSIPLTDLKAKVTGKQAEKLEAAILN